MTTYNFILLGVFTLLFIILIYCLFTATMSKTFKWITCYNEYQFPKDYYLCFEQRVRNAGYKFEEHTVETEDGFILKVFRIKQ